MTTAKKTTAKTAKAKTVTARAAAEAAESTNETASAVKAPAEAVERTLRLTHAPDAMAAAPASGAIADVMALNTAAFAVALEAGGAMLKGMGDINRELFAYARSTVDTGVEGTKVLMGARTVDEVVAVQRHMVQRSMTDLVAESTKIGQLAVKTANAAGAPISAHVTETFKTLARPTSM